MNIDKGINNHTGLAIQLHFKQYLWYDKIVKSK